ncbi:MAG: hypothetical protein IJU23_05205 [Proteobacteria bacterium]|nr:hypothetical protein [Pseudomonadota bacterium]
MKRSLFRAVILIGLLLAMPLTAMAQNEDLTPTVNRVKIDAVDVSDAPNIRIRATALERNSYPVKPDKISTINVISEGEVVSATPKIKALRDSDIPIDVALIVPMSQRFSERELENMKAGINKILDNVRKEDGSFPGDRVAGFFDDGRGINVVPLGEASEVGTVLSKAHPQGQPSFLYSSMEKAMEMMVEAADKRKNSRRAIIIVTDAFDSYTFKKEEVSREIFSFYKEAKNHGISIYVVMYKPFIRSLMPLFEGLSRKTGGTYRYAEGVDDITKGINYAWGEIYGELVIDFKQDLTEGDVISYQLEVLREDGIKVESQPYGGVTVPKLKFNWVKFGIIAGIVAGVILIIVIVLLLIRRNRRKKAEMEAALLEQEIQEKIERGEVCPKCRRTLMKDWKECLFCAREAADELNKKKAEDREKAIEEAKKKGIDPNRTCPKCGRNMMPQWKECLFCKAGIGSEAKGKKKGVAPMAEKKKKEEATGERICPVCKRAMKAHWTTCLYCEAEKEKNAPAEAKKEEKPADNVRICPDCGRPMKAHWDICLYCEANRAKD